MLRKSGFLRRGFRHFGRLWNRQSFFFKQGHGHSRGHKGNLPLTGT
jgi:hypothetical protein